MNLGYSIGPAIGGFLAAVSLISVLHQCCNVFFSRIGLFSLFSFQKRKPFEKMH
ncbi:hypothetical protein QW060_25190 [Myroides ceti]|uniref:Uncharacterized protein n=1 Tax=Paenimyroides ceti TaxID=395087 RepID=A0ABT8D021_9FLAO|nr:hypothetical protein [Paenimyroides ceti]MDN3710173.1 hypothetical protein [Paenimyroides ceti]